MDLTLQTTRLRLAPLDSSDVDVSIAVFSDPEVARFVGGVMRPEDIRRKMSDWTKRGADGSIGIWSIADRFSNEKFGSVFLLPMPIDKDDTDYDLVIPNKFPDADIEIGFSLKRSAWGCGYATEACSRLVRFAFEQTSLNEIFASFHDDNFASRHVLEKSGFIDRGRMWCYGEDAPCYRITREEWCERGEGLLS
jgi:ribosomal-protein-alanine N-acetyltransferase